MEKTAVLFLSAMLLLGGRAQPVQRTLPDSVVTEGRAAGEVIIDIRTGNFTITQINNHDETIFHEHFDITINGMILTKNIVDRDLIASRLQEQHEPVFFNITIHELINFVIQRSTTVILRVLDLDDNVPTFTDPFLQLSIYEGSQTSMADTVIPRAKDDDEGVNTVLNYTLLPLDGVFTLDIRRDENNFITELRLVQNQELDREIESSYSLQIMATEGNENPDTAVLMINVTIEDVCDEPPRFLITRYFVDVEENKNPYTILRNISAVDLDINPVITYTIRDICTYQDEDTPPCNTVTSAPFSLNMDMESGDLVITEALDREAIAQYEITILAEDECGSTGTATVVVTVLNLNDNPPNVGIIIPVENVTEGINAGFIVYFLFTTDDDDDAGAMFTYEVIDSSTGLPTSLFCLETERKELKTAQPLDREESAQYLLLINVTDWGSPNMSTQLTLPVVVLDVNDNPPIFDPVQDIYTISENFDGTIVRLRATDRDSVETGNGRVSYLLPESNSSYPHQGLFTISQQGHLTAAATLDREEQATLTVLIQARDNPSDGNADFMSDFVEVNLVLSDENDNTPTILTPPEVVFIPEDHPNNTVVFTVTAMDDDTAPFSTLTFSLISPTASPLPFRIDPATGNVTLESSLDYEELTSYTVLVEASDVGLTGNRTVEVMVQDVNDERCKFNITGPYMMSIYENRDEGLSVVDVIASDRDTPDSQLQFQITTGNDLGHFRIDATSGEISTTTMLDHDRVMNYTLRVSCSDGPATPNEIGVFVQVLDENDNVPVFTQDAYSFSIREERPAETDVGSVVANDRDSGDNGLVHYRIISSTPSSVQSWFRLDEVTGQITTTRVLDREDDLLVGVEDSRISLNVEAYDVPDRFNTTMVYITILDTNDKAPVFPDDNITFILPENYTIGLGFPSRITAVDADAPPYNDIVYAISGRSPEAMLLFSITPDTGVLSLIATLDFEDVEQRRHEFTVLATDSDMTNMEDQLQVIVIVTDVPETNIKFCEFATMKNVYENAPGQNVSKVLVTDLVGNPLMMNLPGLIYHIRYQDGTMPVNFGIANDTANSMLVIYVKGNIDREAYGVEMVTEVLVVTAIDPDTSDQSHGSTSAILTVTIVDENDNSPAFSQGLYAFNVMENLDPLSIGYTPATDPDFDRNGTLGITYSIVESVPFSIDSSGELRTTRSLNRENISRYDFTVLATDGGSDLRSSGVQVTVIVLDVNDNRPLFDVNQNRTLVVGEETSVNTIVAVLRVSDADVGSYGDVTLRSGDVKSSHFSVGPDGSITLVQSLDREERSLHFFTAEAIDGGGLSTMADINIAVRDYNDNAPVFDPVSDFKVMEDAEEGAVIATVTAHDDDIGSNGDVNYAIGNYSLSFLFSINPSSGEISLQSQHSSCDSSVIDYERESEYYVSIVAYDLGSPRHFVATTIKIVIRPVNEYSPAFDRALVQTYVDETQRSGEEVLRIRAVDRDKDNQITYEVYEGDVMSSLFRYDQARGTIVNTGILDYNSKSQYTLTLRASDMDSNVGSTQVVVNVVNINNHAPVFDEDRSPNTANQPIVVSESIPVSTVLRTVRATDGDNTTHDAVSYFLESEENNGEFAINPLTGEISVSSALDFEMGQEYTLRVTARDTGTPQLTSTALTLIIDIVNENDESPIFNSSGYMFLLQENQPEGSIVGNVYAPDRDVGSFGEVQYSISGGVNEYFDINRDSGQIFTRARIDRDTLSSVTFDFRVLATDGAPGLAVRTAGADVTITIVDVNDNPPEFESPQYLIPISPNQAPSVSLATLTVSDRDEGVNAEYLYEINPQSEEEVEVQLTNTGSLSLVRTLPSAYHPVYIYTVRAIDARDSSLHSTARVELIVETENDHQPVFSPVRSTRSISELAPMGGEVFRLDDVVTDGDSGENGRLSYQLVDDHSEFVIDGESGAISLREMLDYESTRAYNLTVMALDHRPGVRRTATGTIEVTVEPGNEHSPMFVGVPSQLTLSYLPEYGLELFTVRAMDGDEGNDGIVKYNLFDNTSYFSIERETGILRNQGVLTSDAIFNLIIGAYDLGNPFRSSNTTIRITIQDPGETTPLFMEENPRMIIQAETDDLDGFLNTALVTNPQAETYHIVKQTVFGETTPIDMFDIIDESDSRLSALAPLDYEDTPRYSIVVESRRETRTDSTIERKSDFLVVTLVVTDVNDNAPLFSAVEDQTYSEATPMGTPLFRVYAVDDDSGLEGEVVYDIIQGDREDTFGINSTTGDVFLNQALDRETVSEYDLVIRAQDLSNSPQLSQVTVHVDIMDVNDFVTTYNGRNYSLGVYEFPHTHIRDEIVQLAATDEDEGPLVYDMEFVGAGFMGNTLDVSQLTNPFDIHPDTGLITVESFTLDRESVDRYTLRVIATDRTHTADTYLFIEVLDVNEAPPVPTYPGEVDVLEGQPVDTLVTDQISVTDPDLGVNSWVLFSLGEGWPEGYFSIDPVSGVIRTTAVTTAMETFAGTVVVEDQGISQHRVTFDIIVTIVDVNDHPPLFESDSITLDLSIAESSNFEIYHFDVTDADSGVNASPLMLTIPHYYMEVHENFYLRPGTKDLILREVQRQSRSYNFVIFVSTPSRIPRCVEYNAASAINVTVNVRPINVACPQFSQPSYEMAVQEETLFSESLAQITSNDPDGDTVEYALEDSSTLPFTIDTQTGDVTLVGTLDRERRDMYSLTVVATDDGFPAMSCSVAVVVTVLDVNDHQPSFLQDTYTGTLAENLPVNSFILQVRATDEDLEEAGSVSYSLSETDAPFRIDPTSGRIFSTLTLDFDTLPTGRYVFSAIASDISMSSSIPVTIDVTDINEHMPMFVTTPTGGPIQVSQQKGKGSTLGTFYAEDADRGTELLYSFGRPMPECYFDINNRTGTITLKVDPNVCGTCVDNLTRRPSADDPEYYIIDTTLIASDGLYADDIEVSFMLHDSFCVTAARGPLPVEIIAGSITVFLAIVLVLLCVIIFACICRSRRSLKVTINDTPQSIEMPKRFESGRSSVASTPAPVYKQTSMSHEHTTMSITHSGSGASSARQSYTCGDMDTVDQNVLYPSPSMISRKSQLSRPCRSTSDLGSSTMATDMLSGESQEPPPYPKAQIEKIYAKNADLLNHSDSNESIHMFGSEGGGESDGGDDMLFAKFNDLDDDDDSMTMQDDDENDRSYEQRRSMTNSRDNLSIPPVMDDAYGFEHPSEMWVPRASEMADAIDQMAIGSYKTEEMSMNMRRSQQHYMNDYNKSQEGVSMYGASTQESTRPLLRHAHPQSRMPPPHHMMQQGGYSSYDNSPAEVRHHGVRDPQLSYGGPSAGMPIYPTHEIAGGHPMARHGGGASQEVPGPYGPMARHGGGASQEVPVPYVPMTRHGGGASQEAPGLYVPMARHGGGASQEVPGPYVPMARHGGGASQEVPGPYGYHADFMHHHHPMHHEMGGVGHSPSSSSTPTEGTLNTRAMTNEYESDINIYSSDTSINTNTESDPPHIRGPGFSQSGHSQGDPPHIRGFSQSQGEPPHIRGFSKPGHSQRHPNYR